MWANGASDDSCGGCGAPECQQNDHICSGFLRPPPIGSSQSRAIISGVYMVGNSFAVD
jgi:hypothetical protein